MLTAEQIEAVWDEVKLSPWPLQSVELNLTMRHKFARALEAKLCALVAEPSDDQDKKDAARYRWLRYATEHDGQLPAVFKCRAGRSVLWSDVLIARELDEAVDQAISRSPA